MISAFILGACICIGLVALGYQLSESIVYVKSLERTIVVKGLSEREVRADIAIWPITFSEAGNDLAQLFSDIQQKNDQIFDFLTGQGFNKEEISVSAPGILDKQAQGYGGSEKLKFRYSGSSTITVYTGNVDHVRTAMRELVKLGKAGIAISGQNYQTQTEFLFTKLNEIKPQMIEEATKNARKVAEKFAKDSRSKLGKIKKATQGQFSISNRDSNTPYIKKVRVVSTIEYLLSD